MKIIYKPNPFETEVVLNEQDKHILLISYQNDEYLEVISRTHFRITHQDSRRAITTLEEVEKELSEWKRIINLKEDSKEILNLINDLNYPHMGDCTCDPCSCSRCYVEDLLGINTIEGLGKHEARKIYYAFKELKDIDAVIEQLSKVETYKKPEKWPDAVGYKMHIPRWERERENANKWLIAYKQKHGF